MVGLQRFLMRNSFNAVVPNQASFQGMREVFVFISRNLFVYDSSMDFLFIFAMDYRQKREVRSNLHVTMPTIHVNVNCKLFFLFTSL